MININLLENHALMQMFSKEFSRASVQTFKILN